jgi:hypothetical protein
LGLGTPYLAAADTLPLFDNMMKEKIIDKNIFSVYLNPVNIKYYRIRAKKVKFFLEKLKQTIWQVILLFIQLLVKIIGKYNYLIFRFILK